MVRLRKNTSNLSKDSRSPGRDLNQGPTKYEAEVVTTGLRSQVYLFSLLSGGKARQGRDADHSPPSSAEVKNE
jgi:hypothetical protein